nr:uncharacterized protein LOC131796842 isoform X1 [Pocillopora verrucosa]
MDSFQHRKRLDNKQCIVEVRLVRIRRVQVVSDMIEVFKDPSLMAAQLKVHMHMAKKKSEQMKMEFSGTHCQRSRQHLRIPAQLEKINDMTFKLQREKPLLDSLNCKVK